MIEFDTKQLESWANILAKWADQMPLRHVYMLDSPRTRDGVDCLGLAIQFGPPERPDGWTCWIQQHDTYFGEIQASLGMPIILYADETDSAWQSIRLAAQNPILTVRKVRVVRVT
jgi:hypothetical protein